ncbi:hypothetical protein EMIT0P171_90010 [Pseudomonas sp. IT-P171]
MPNRQRFKKNVVLTGFGRLIFDIHSVINMSREVGDRRSIGEMLRGQWLPSSSANMYPAQLRPLGAR